jgi:tRNA nucleotidyltransferase (CCA-adding enzyme)
MSDLFTAAPVLAALEGEPDAWVVGGAVRDLLLGLEPDELDVVVEGDAVAVARRAAARLGGDVLVHERFGTATVRGRDVAFDIAGARRESYARPGALPDVELGATLADDLARRDFTVNALALRLADGFLTGWPGSEDDLRGRVLRVLRDTSFLDDPTRLVRLARYAGRLGFAVESRTAGLAAAAIAGGALGTVSGERLGAELRLLAREPQPAALVELERGGLGAALLPAFAVDAGLVERGVALCAVVVAGGGGAVGAAGGGGAVGAAGGGGAVGAAGAEDAVEASGGRRDLQPPRADLVALAATVRGAERDVLAVRLRELAFPTAEADAIVAAATVDAAALAGARPSQADVTLARRPPEAAVVAAAAGAEPARDWLLRGRHARLAIGGDDLLAAGLRGPAVGRGLAAARAALLDGQAPGRDAQLRAALAAGGAGRERR